MLRRSDSLMASCPYATVAWASRVPQPPKYGSKTPSDQEVYAFNEEARAVNRPAQTLARGLADGNLSKRQVDAIQATAPRILDTVQQALEQRMAVALSQDKTLPWDVRRDMALLFGIDSDWSMTAAGLRVLQGNATQTPEQQQDKPNKRSAPAQTPSATQMQTDVQRREGGQIR